MSGVKSCAATVTCIVIAVISVQRAQRDFSRLTPAASEKLRGGDGAADGDCMECYDMSPQTHCDSCIELMSGSAKCVGSGVFNGCRGKSGDCFHCQLYLPTTCTGQFQFWDTATDCPEPADGTDPNCPSQYRPCGNAECYEWMFQCP